jgi:hypothetical protein
MSCCPGGEFIPQKEAFWMEWTSAPDEWPMWNWLDGSMISVAVGSKSSPTQRYEYIFNQSDLDPLPSKYYDDRALGVPLPVADVESLGQQPAHSALLVGFYPSSKIPSDKYYGVYWSKCGSMWLAQHRWGEPFIFPDYCLSANLQVFAPRAGWAPPYIIVPTAWGDFP